MSAKISFYEVEADVDAYQYLLIEGDRPQVRFDGAPARDRWFTPDAISYHPRLREGAFWGVLGFGGACFAVRPEALGSTDLQMFLRPSGELLEVRCGGKEFVVLNVTECLEALDREQTVFDDYDDLEEHLEGVDPSERERILALPDDAEVDQPVFRLDRLGGQLFKVPETAMTAIYYWERDVDGEEEQFRRFCKNHDLEGLTFKHLYTTDSPW